MHSTSKWIMTLALFAAGPTWANVITNGSFETPVVPVGSFTLYTVGSAALTDWSVVGPSGKRVGVVSGTFAQSGATFNSQDGSQWLDLTGFNDNSTEGVSQTVATNIGDQYQLSYYIGNTTAAGFGPTSKVDVSVNSVATFSDTNSTVSPTSLNWLQITHTFVANTGSTTLAFVNGDSPSDGSNGLDNIVLTDLGPAVPLPAAGWLLVSGLGGLAAIGRRRTT